MNTIKDMRNGIPSIIEALMAANGFTETRDRDCIEVMREEIEAGESPDDVLGLYGLEIDYLIDLAL